MRFRNVIIGAVSLGLVTSCASEDQVSDGGAGISDVVTDYTDVEKSVVGETRSFDFSFFKSACEGENGNVIVSPLSMQMLLGATALAADEASAEEIACAMGCSDLATLGDFHGKVVRRYPQDGKGVDISLANAVWYAEGLSPEINFSRNFAEIYDGEMFQLNRNSLQYVEQLNKWCSEKTNGLIPSMLHSFPADVELVMANAMYFNGKWDNPFLAEETSKSIFHGSEGDCQVDMMHHDGLQNFWVADGYKAVMMDMGAGEYTATFVLPDDGKDLGALIKELDYTALVDAPRMARKVKLYLPKCKLQPEGGNLSHALKALGIECIFDGGYLSSFNYVADGVQFFQKVAVEFNEKGSEGASVSWNFWPTDSGDDNDAAAVPVIEFNRPYLFFINERETGVCLLCGRIENL